MDRAVPRRLDLMDVLVLGTGALGSGRWIPSNLVPLSGSDPAELATVTFTLLNETDPMGVQCDGDWTLGLVDELDLTGRSARAAAAARPRRVGLGAGGAGRRVEPAGPSPPRSARPRRGRSAA